MSYLRARQNNNFEKLSFKIIHLPETKLMRFDRGWPEIRSKLYSNRLLIDIFDPNLHVWSIVATIWIQIRIQIRIQISISD